MTSYPNAIRAEHLRHRVARIDRCRDNLTALMFSRDTPLSSLDACWLEEELTDHADRLSREADALDPPAPVRVREIQIREGAPR